jgi:hypothetical protein
MPIKFCLFTSELVSSVKEFNFRLERAGCFRKFCVDPDSKWLPNKEDRELYEEFILAVDERSNVRGAYVFKHQIFYIKGGSRPICNIRNPISEGVVNKKYSLIAFQLINDALKKQPFIMGLGMGGYSQPLPKMFKKMGWALEEVPFLFRVVRPQEFLKNISYLRKNLARIIFVEILRVTGLGSLGIKSVQKFLLKKKNEPGPIRCELVIAFDKSADELWEKCHREYCLIALRDSETLNILYPESEKKFFKLKIISEKGVIGWAVVLATKMNGHKQFGNMKVGSIIDCMASYDNSYFVIESATRFLENQRVDIIVSNQASDNWCESLKENGFIKGPSNFLVTLSKNAIELLSPFEENKGRMHLNRGDGDGPINL